MKRLRKFKLEVAVHVHSNDFAQLIDISLNIYAFRAHKRERGRLTEHERHALIHMPISANYK